MKNKTLLLFSFLLLTITSCKADVTEVFYANQYESADFLENYYTNYPIALKNHISSETTYDLDDSHYRYELITDTTALNAVVTEDETRGHDLNMAYQAWWYYGTLNRLSNIDKSFRYGYFSKLTDGLLNCDGSGAPVRIQINEEGIGQFFTKELVDYTSIILTFRGGTNTPWETLDDVTKVTTASIRLSFSFYVLQSNLKDYQKITFNAVVDTRTDDHGSITNVMQFYFDDVLTTNEAFRSIKRATAMSISYELLNHDYVAPLGVDNPNNDYEFALMLYEVMLPYSRWN